VSDRVQPIRYALCVAVTLLTVGCASVSSTVSTTPPATETATTPRWALQGQMSIKLAAWLDQPAQGVTVGYFLEGSDEAGQMALMTPLGSQMARVEWQPDSVWLDDGRQRRPFASPEALSEQLFGEALPLQALPWWMQGLPAPGLPHQPTSDGAAFEQVGWRITRPDPASGRIVAERPGSPAQRPVTIRIHPDR